MDPINIVPTFYDGIRFRSRLEARWAVFFKALEIRYEWEPESFNLEDCFYIPDFYLPIFNNGVYCEVKPIGGNFDKARLFTEKTGKPIWLCEGPPDFRIYTLLEVDYYDKNKIDVWKVIPKYSSGFEENRFWYEPGFEEYYPSEYSHVEFQEAVFKSKNERFGIYE